MVELRLKGGGVDETRYVGGGVVEPLHKRGDIDIKGRVVDESWQEGGGAGEGLPSRLICPFLLSLISRTQVLVQLQS